MRKSFFKEKVFYCLTFVLLAFATAASAQVTVTGTVTDDMGPIIGCNVLLKGTGTGVSTDLDGNFTISVPDKINSVLQFSYIGYDTQEVKVNGRTHLEIHLKESTQLLQEVTIVAYGVQKKETLTGAIASVQTEDLLVSPNASVANSLAGKITGLSSVQASGQPGLEDPKIFIRGVGSLTEGGASPLILVDGVERSFFQMDPNEIENVTVLKDASATAVFGVRGANGVILVTTRRGKEGKAKISISSSVGAQTPTRMLNMADSYTYAVTFNEQETNDGRKPVFSDYAIERFRLGDQPIIYPSIRWREYMMKKYAMQTQHSMNISGGSERVKYFISLGFLYQDGLLKNFGYKNLGYKYKRYNYRTNLDLDITKSTLLKLGIGGVVGDRLEPTHHDIWNTMNWSPPFSSAGVIDGHPIISTERFEQVLLTDPLKGYVGKGFERSVNNNMNLDLHLVQKLDFITKGLSAEIKGAYNTDYTHIKIRKPDTGVGETEQYMPFYESELDGSGLKEGDPGYNYNIVYRVIGRKGNLGFQEKTGRGRNWYFESSVRYNRKFGDHNVGGLFLYNQSKRYYPRQLNFIPTAYVGFVGRLTYDYKSRYMAEINYGYNGSENFAPDKRYGSFPALSLGYIISEEEFMKDQNIFDFLKLRASIGLVGNDNMRNNRFLYLPDSYDVDKMQKQSSWNTYIWGYNFGYDNQTWIPGSVENRLGNPNVTWETALKQNYGIDMNFLRNRLRFKADFFMENRKDILISRNTVPGFTALNPSLLPVVNLGEVENKGYEVEINWNDKIGDVDYFINPNLSYSRNKIIFQDEVEPNEPYLWRTGQPVGTVFGYVAQGFYNDEHFNITTLADGTKEYKLKDGLPVPQVPVYPGDVIYQDLNEDGVIDPDDQKNIGFPNRPNYVFGLNMGASYKNFFFSMNWAGAAERSLVLQSAFREPFSGGTRSLLQFHVDKRWTPDRADVAEQPRFSRNSNEHNYQTSTLWVQNGSYLKLKNLTVGYNFNKNKTLSRLGISQLGLKFTAYNLLTFDYFGIMDPESNPDRWNDTYPVVRIFNLGANLTF